MTEQGNQPTLEPRVAWRIAVASYKNACAYVEQCALLTEHGWHWRACSLAILGQEEAGKALYFWSVAIGAMRQKPDALEAMFESHEWKQRFAQVAVDFVVMRKRFTAAVQPMLESVHSLAQADPPISNEGQLIAALSQLQQQLMQHMESISPEITASVAPLKGRVRGLKRYSAQKAKHMGLYVGLSKDRRNVLMPERVERRRFRREATVLKIVLRLAAPLFSDPDLDEGSIEQANRAITAARSGEGSI